MTTQEILTNGYVRYFLFIFSTLRVARIFMADDATQFVRNIILRKKLVDGLNIEKENILKDDGTPLYSRPGKVTKFLRLLFKCEWCLPTYTVSAHLTLTLLFPGVLAMVNLFFGSLFIVSFLYSRMAK